MENNTTNFAAQNSASVPAQSAASAPASYNQGGTKKSSSILTIVFLITTLGFAGAFAWAMLRDTGGTKADTASTTCAVTEEEVAAAEEGTVAEVVANYDTDKEVKELVKELISSYSTKDNLHSSHPMIVDSGAVAIELDGGVTTYVTKSYGVMTARIPDELYTDYENATIEYLTSNGFVLNSNLSGDHERYYDKGDIRCAVIGDSNPFMTNCSNLKWVSESEKALETALYNAYKKSEGSVPDGMAIYGDPNKIVTSSDGKYERLQGSLSFVNSPIGGGYLLFYREVGSGEWIYIVGGNGIPLCSDFDDAATAAYKGSGFGCQVNDTDIKNVGE